MRVIGTIRNWLWPNEIEERFVVEDPNELGYTLTTRFFGASKETKRTLLGMMPETEWDEIRDAAIRGFNEDGSYYPENRSLFHEH